MKLIMAVVNKPDSKALVKNLMAQGFQVTKLSSSGGFLKAGNVTFLCGVNNEREQDCLAIIEKTCRAKIYTSRSVTTEGSSLIPQNINGSPLMSNEIVSGGATVFVLNIENHIKY